MYRFTFSGIRIFPNEKSMHPVLIVGYFIASVIVMWIVLGNLLCCYGLIRFRPPPSSQTSDQRRRITLQFLLRFRNCQTLHFDVNFQIKFISVMFAQIYALESQSPRWHSFKTCFTGHYLDYAGCGLVLMSCAAQLPVYHLCQGFTSFYVNIFQH